MHTQPTAQPFRGLASHGGNSASLEGSPPRPLEAQANSASPKTHLAEPSAGPRRGGNSASLETPLGGLWQRPNHLTGRGAF